MPFSEPDRVPSPPWCGSCFWALSSFLLSLLLRFLILLLLDFGLHVHIRLNTCLLDVATFRRVVVGSRHAEARPVRKRHYRLNGGFFRTISFEDYRTIMILQGTGHNLRGAGAALVDQDAILKLVMLGGVVGAEFHPLILTSAVRVNDQALVYEQVGHLDRLI